MSSPRPLNEEASEAFIQRAVGEWGSTEEARLEARLAEDSHYAQAFRDMEKSWQSLGVHAETPELMRLRQSALAWIGRENHRRWKTPSTGRRWLLAAGVAAITVGFAVILQWSPYGYHPGLYRTTLGQQSRVDLSDHSRIELDAATRVQVQFSDAAREVRLLEGQAEFSVAKDATRPFRVRAGDRTIVAVGTVFTVEYVDRQVRVATLEGKVIVSPGIAVSAGEAVRIGANGRIDLKPRADLAAATAWRDGNVIFRDEPLGEAVRRLNRYSRLKLSIGDDSLAMLRISGVFDKGDSTAFARSVEAYYPVFVDRSDPDALVLKLK